MTKWKNMQEALVAFESAADQHQKATDRGDYKSANRNYEIIASSIAFMKNNNALAELLAFLEHSSVGVRMWSATYLLPTHENQAKEILLSITRTNGIQSLTAKTTLSEWEKGHLKL